MIEPGDEVAERLLDSLASRAPAVALLPELTLPMRPRPTGGALEAALRALVSAERIVVADHAAPDVHLEGTDLRILALRRPGDDVVAAQAAADGYWDAWLRQFLNTHRCQ